MVEVCIATLVLGILIGSILTVVTQAYVILSRSRETLRANQILQQEMETIRTYSWSQMTNSSNFGSATYTDQGVRYSVSRSVSNCSNSTSYGTNYMKQVTVTVTWTNMSGQAISKNMTTLITQGGLNDYIY